MSIPRGLCFVVIASSVLLSGCGGGGGGDSNNVNAPFGSPLFTEMGGPPSNLAWGDFNGDGKTDVVFSLKDGNIYFMAGDGGGTFQSSRVTGGLSAIYSVAAGDLNGDGKVDLVVVGCPMPACANTTYPNDATPFVMLGNGDGTFRAPVMYPTSYGANRVAVGDFNGDGRLDVAVGYQSPQVPVVSVLLGNGDGTLKAATDWPVFSRGGVASSVAVGDMNGDGKQDLVVGQCCLGSNFSVLLGHGDGTFDAPLATVSSQDPSSLQLADFNNDGKPDVATSGNFYPAFGAGGPGNLIVFLNEGNGTLGPATYASYPWAYETASFATADIDRDGNVDLVVRAGSITANLTGLSLLYGKGDGTFSDPVDFPMTFEGRVHRLIDLNGDGRPDLVVLTATGIAVLINTD